MYMYTRYLDLKSHDEILKNNVNTYISYKLFRVFGDLHSHEDNCKLDLCTLKKECTSITVVIT